MRGRAFRFGLFHCCECGEGPFPEQKGVLNDHLVTAHGYIREGGQVFKRHFCEVEGCGKPALSKWGVRFFCGDHKGFAIKVALSTTEFRTSQYEERGRQFDEPHLAADKKAAFRRSSKGHGQS